MVNERITIRLTPDIIQKLDERIKEEGFSNRSEYLRKIITDLFKSQEGKGSLKPVDVCDSRSKRFLIEISEETYMLLLDMQAQGIFHGPIEYILSNEVERALLRHLREIVEARRKDIEIINSGNSKGVG